MAQTVGSYLRTQALACGAINAVVNPALAWLLNRRMEPVPLDGLVVDTAITCVVLSLLVSLFTTAGVRRALASGEIFQTGEPPGAGPFLARLPRGPAPLGLALGIAAGGVLTPAAWGLVRALQVEALPFAGFVLFKAVYTGVLGSAVTRRVILRQLATRG